ncbi:MAG: protein kinase [Myxococcales bacterium]|nr:protein kinase [Myxococcales bacterium]
MEWERLRTLLARELGEPVDRLYAEFCEKYGHHSVEDFVAHLWHAGRISEPTFRDVHGTDRIEVHLDDGDDEDPFAADQMLMEFTRIPVHDLLDDTDDRSEGTQRVLMHVGSESTEIEIPHRGGWVDEPTPIDEETLDTRSSKGSPYGPRFHADRLLAAVEAEIRTEEDLEAITASQQESTSVTLKPQERKTTYRDTWESKTGEPMIGRYRVLGPIGRGGVGVVSLARDESLHRKVALKQLHDVSESKDVIRHRFLREAQVTAQLDHPNIVPLYSLEYSKEGKPAYAMKLVQGRTLQQLLREVVEHYEAGKPLPRDLSLETRLEHFIKVCDAVAYSHNKDVIHRDLKPANIMIGRYNQVYLMDWGLARLLYREEREHSIITPKETSDASMEETLSGQILGTPPYMSPEQAAGLHPMLDGRSDLYALGLILFELVTLRPAITGIVAAEILAKAMRGHLAPMEHLKGERIPSALRAIIEKATRVERDERYASVDELAEDLRRYLRGETLLARPDTPLQKIGRYLLKHRQLSLIILLSFSLFSTGLIILSQIQRYRSLEIARMREGQISRILTATALQANLIENRLLRVEEGQRLSFARNKIPLSQLKMPAGLGVQQAYLLESSGKILLEYPKGAKSQPSPKQGYLSQPSVMRAISAGSSGMFEDRTSDGTYLYAFYRLDALGWYFVARCDLGALLREGR